MLLRPISWVAGFACLCAIAEGRQDPRPSIQIDTSHSVSEHALGADSGTSVAAYRDSVSGAIYATTSKDGGLTWAPPIDLSEGDGGNVLTLARDAVYVEGKEVHVFWYEHLGSGIDEGVHMAHSSDGGLTFEEVILPLPGGTGDVTDLVAEVEDGKVTVLFTWATTSFGDMVYVVGSDDDNPGTFHPPLQALSLTAFVQGIDLAVVGDEVHAIWMDDRNATSVDLFYRRSLDRGQTWADASDAQLSDSFGVTNVDGVPQVLASDMGGGITRVAVFWREDVTVATSFELLSRVSTSSGAAFDLIESISGPSTGFGQAYEFAAVDANDGGLTVVWTDDRVVARFLYSSRSIDDGSSWTSLQVVSFGDAAEPCLVAGNDLDVAATWRDLTVVPSAVWGAVSSDAGATWDPSFIVSDNVETVGAPLIAFDPSCENYVHDWRVGDSGLADLHSGGYLNGTCGCTFPDDGNDETNCFERDYTPPDLSIDSHPRQRLTIFYPDEDDFPKPDAGWPVLMYSPAGAFAEALALGGEGAPLRAICGEPPSTSTSGNTIGLKILNDALKSGFVVITVGSVGWNSEATLVNVSPNLFHDPLSSPGDVLWDDFSTFYGEKDMTWARQYVAEYANKADGTCPPLDIDNDRVFLTGVSTGGIYSSFVALGPDRAWDTDYSSQSQQSTKCAGVLVLASPTWFDAYDKSNFGFHWPKAGSTTLRAETLLEADKASLVASSISTWVRQPGSMSVDTPVFLAFNEPLGETDFSREGGVACGDPTLSGVVQLSQLHDTWFGLIGFEDLACSSPNRQGYQSRLWISDSVDLSVLEPEQARLPTGRFAGTIFQDALQNEMLEWLLGPRADATVRNDAGSSTDVNPLCHETLSPAVLGGTWRGRMDRNGDPATLSSFFAYETVFGVPVPYKGFYIFPNLFSPLLVADFQTSFDGDAAYHEAEVPDDLSLLGVTIYAQSSLSGGGPLKLCNGVDILIGY